VAAVLTGVRTKALQSSPSGHALILVTSHLERPALYQRSRDRLVPMDNRWLGPARLRLGRDMSDKVAVMTADLGASVRAIVGSHGGLPSDLDDLRDSDDLFRAGMSTQDSVRVMLALEESFDIEFPENMLRRSTFASVSAIRRAVLALLCERELVACKEAP